LEPGWVGGLKINQSLSDVGRVQSGGRDAKLANLVWCMSFQIKVVLEGDALCHQERYRNG